MRNDLIARLEGLVQKWRDISGRPNRPTGFLLCADELAAVLSVLRILRPTRMRNDLIAPRIPECCECLSRGVVCHHLQVDATQAEQAAWWHGYAAALSAQGETTENQRRNHYWWGFNDGMIEMARRVGPRTVEQHAPTAPEWSARHKAAAAQGETAPETETAPAPFEPCPSTHRLGSATDYQCIQAKHTGVHRAVIDGTVWWWDDAGKFGRERVRPAAPVDGLSARLTAAETWARQVAANAARVQNEPMVTAATACADACRAAITAQGETAPAPVDGKCRACNGAGGGETRMGGPEWTCHVCKGTGKAAAPLPPDPPDPLTDERRHAPDPLRTLLLDLYALIDTRAPETELRDLLTERRPFVHLILTNGRG